MVLRASTGKGKVQQRLEGCAELFQRGRFGRHFPRLRGPIHPKRLIRIALCKPFTQSTKPIHFSSKTRSSIGRVIFTLFPVTSTMASSPVVECPVDRMKNLSAA